VPISDAAIPIGQGVKRVRGSVIGLSLVSILAFVECFKLCFGFAYFGTMYEDIADYGLRSTSIALFDRVGGGIYTKAADVGTDLSGKNDYGLHDDDYRNKDLGSLAASSSSASSAKAVAS